MDFYVTIGGRFGRWRHWEDMRSYGFVSAGHGARYRDAMSRLIEGARVWPVIPVAVGGGHAYVGVGRVTAEAVRVRDFKVDVGGTAVPILTAPLAATDMGERADDPELSEYVARVRWIDSGRRRKRSARPACSTVVRSSARSATHSPSNGFARRSGRTPPLREPPSSWQVRGVR
jgi:hypothetical protein